MKVRFFAILAALMLVFSLVGCTQSAPPVSQQSGSGSEAVEQQAVDRYAELLDIPEGKLAIYFFQLDHHLEDTDKSGDSALLLSPDGKTMLLDAGNVSCSDQVLGYLKDLGITKIDYLVATHPHIDHIGGMVAVAKEHEIGMHYRTTLEYVTNTYVDYNAYFKKQEIPTTTLHEGDTFDFGEFVHVTVLNPPEEIEYPKDYPENRNTQFVNNTSITLRFDYGQSTFLSCGDLYQGREKELLEKYPDLVDVDVAKANHHGLDTSNSSRWVKAVTPQYVIAMSDDISSMSIYERYKKSGASYYNTSYDGIVRVVMDDQKNYEVLTQHDSWLRD